MTDDLLRSMKEQMQPSDAVVSDLLAKIDAASLSPVTTPVKVIQKKKKPIWYYGTALAASVVVLFSTFLLLDQTGGESPDAVKNLLNQVTDPNSAVTQPQGDRYANGLTGDDDRQPAIPPARRREDGTFTEADPSAQPDADSSVVPAVTKPGTNSGADTPKPGKPAADNGDKITPGAPGTGDISWTSEIMSATTLSSISVLGSDYVVESTASKSDISEPIETVTVKLPQTSSTKPAKLQATCYSLKNISADAMVALDVEGFAEPLIYSNSEYSPITIGGLLADLGLQGNTKFSTTVKVTDASTAKSTSATYKKALDEAVWKYLFSDTSVGLASELAYQNGVVKATFVSDENPTGSRMSFGVSSNGFLHISMTAGSFTFHIGTANAKAFIEYVTGNPLTVEG